MLKQELKTATNQRNYSFDILKTLFMVLVVFIHATFPGTVGEIIKTVARIAVPGFFIISGYYVYGADAKKILNRAKKTTWLILMASLIYFCVFLLLVVKEKVFTPDVSWNNVFAERFASILPGGVVADVLKIVVFQLNPFAGHLWYLSSLVMTYLFFAFLKKKEWLETVVNWLPLLLIGAIALGAVNAKLLGETMFYIHRNAYFVGIPFMAIGYIIRNKEQQIKKYSSLFFGVLAIFGIALSLVERLFVYTDMYIGVIISVSALFALAIKKPIEKPNRISCFGERYSGDVYVVHLLPINLVPPIVSVIFGGSINAWIYPIIILILSIILAVIFNWFKNLMHKIHL